MKGRVDVAFHASLEIVLRLQIPAHTTWVDKLFQKSRNDSVNLKLTIVKHEITNQNSAVMPAQINLMTSIRAFLAARLVSGAVSLVFAVVIIAIRRQQLVSHAPTASLQQNFW